jgi:hypothetical protein
VDLADRKFALAASAPSPNSSATSTSGTWNIPRRSTTIQLRFGDTVALLLAELAPAAFSLGMGILLGSVDYSSLRRGRASR